ncbi:citrate synthase family protein [Caballeronia sp. BR00000012568055]|uniref:citrate synthase family protein n=1 Tax=Caballeronia sp. BR00000012568055 TaxID=2918761 RepID=UPI0023F7DAA8|nr:citrate synthase family protein [Caballeronia sp. BR00000012568055]
MIDSINVKNWMTQEQACDALGVRKQTLYAYVSRGQIEVQGDPEHANRKLYRASDIAALLKKRNTGRARKNIAASTMAWGEPIINTRVSTIARGRLFYRGKDAVLLASSATLEAAAGLLWDAPHEPRFASVAPLGIDGSSARARLFAAIGIAAADDTLSFDDLCDEGAHLIGLFASNSVALPMSDEPLHQRIARAWHADVHADLLRRVLVLLADQELSSSAFAARVTASTGASLGASMLAGLAAFSGPMHGNAIVRVRNLLEDAARMGSERAVRLWLSNDKPLAGFGHELYPQGDPRAADLLSAFEPPALVRELIERVESVTGAKPTIDIALAALVEHCALPEGAAFALFSIARSVGWIAHSIEQMTSGTLLRPRAHYVGAAVEERD